MTLTEIRNAISVVELVSEYLPLKKAGQGYVGLCPFHGEKTPSFHVHPIKQCFHCFGCQKGGNLFTFLCLIEGLSFPEAVQKLAKRAGIELREDANRRPATVAADTKTHERLYAAQEWAAKYFNYLLNEVPEYKFAKDYLIGRGISEKSIERFKIGVSPKGWNTLMDLMLKRNFTMNELIASGLVVSKEESPRKGYDRFRQRLMFPIREIEGKVIGFGARLLHEDPKQPKYLNSPESPLFSKRQHFYGLHENQRGIRVRGEALIVEGYMDVVGLNEHGVNNALATMGTALTEEHCSQLRGMTSKVVTVFDADAGGQEAYRRSVHLFLNAGIFAKDLSLPEGKDPDEFIQSQGEENFYKLCEKAPRQITKLLKEIASEGNLSEEETARWLDELTPILVASRRSPDRAVLWDNISLVLKISVQSLRELAEGAMARTAAQGAHKSNSAPAQGASRSPRPGTKRPARPLNALDLEFFQVSLRFPEDFLKIPLGDWADAIKDERMRHWLKRLHESGSVAGMFGVGEELIQTETDPRLQSAATACLLGAEGGATAPAEEQPQGLLDALCERLKKRRREDEVKALSAQIRLSERMGNNEEGIRLLEQLKLLRST